MVDNVFDFAEQLLASQREFVKNLAAVSTQAAQAINDQTRRAAESVTTGAANAGEATARSVSQVGRFASEQTDATTRPGRNANR
jgi:enoyl-CoA hydratase/carnithine racemase